MNFSTYLLKRLRCPRTHQKLLLENNFLITKDKKLIRYPLVNNIPILINEDTSLFSFGDFVNRKNTTWNLKQKKIYKIIENFSPSIGLNLKAKKNFKKIHKLLPSNAKILVVGGGIEGVGIDVLYKESSFEIIGMDVSFAPKTNLIADGHDIPFEDSTFDCVIIQAVLEHVLDPARCIHEIHRVLKVSGLVYAETPFMQQVHMGAYDFTRFTHLGHRRLFRRFVEIEHAPLMGPGSSLAWAYTYFLASFTSSKHLGMLIKIFAHSTSFFLKYFDYYLIDKPGSYDAASAFFFLGKKSKKELSDKELLKEFKGKI